MDVEKWIKKTEKKKLEKQAEVCSQTTKLIIK